MIPKERSLRCLDLFGERPRAFTDQAAARFPGLEFECLRQGLEIHVSWRVRTGTSLHVRAGEDSRKGAVGAAMDQAEAWLREKLGPLIYSDRGETFSAATLRALREAGLRVAMAESLTGGLASAMLTDAPGASEVFLGAAVTYSSHLKEAWLDVPPSVLAEPGPVSEPSAKAMAEGALRLSGAELALSLTGWAGPEPGSDGQPAGTVYLALARSNGFIHVERQIFPGARADVRKRAAYRGLDLIRRHALGLPLVP